MLSDAEISEQLALLAIHCRTLAVYRRQQAMLGVLAPPGVANGIAERYRWQTTFRGEAPAERRTQAQASGADAALAPLN